MTFSKFAATGAVLAATLVAGSALAKGHDNGFGGGAKGGAAGFVDDNQSNNDGSNFGGDGRDSAYGVRDASLEAKAGERDRSEDAQMQDDSHPSFRSDR